MTITNKENVVAEKIVATFAIPLDPEHYELIRSAAKVQGIPAAEFGRNFLLAESAKIMGVDTPVVVKSKRGPKGGSKHPLAEKFGLTTTEFNRRATFHIRAHALSGSKKKFDLDKVDFSINPFAKPVEETTVEVVQTELPVETVTA